jgi:hypothetical protein
LIRAQHLHVRHGDRLDGVLATLWLCLVVALPRFLAESPGSQITDKTTMVRCLRGDPNVDKWHSNERLSIDDSQGMMLFGGACNALKESADMINLRAHCVYPAHQADRSMHHTFPEVELGTNTRRRGSRFQPLGIIQQRVKFTCSDVKRWQPSKIG